MRWFFQKGIGYGERMTRMKTIEGRQLTGYSRALHMLRM
jgi:hypothetical protein